VRVRLWRGVAGWGGVGERFCSRQGPRRASGSRALQDRMAPSVRARLQPVRPQGACDIPDSLAPAQCTRGYAWVCTGCTNAGAAASRTQKHHHLSRAGTRQARRSKRTQKRGVCAWTTATTLPSLLHNLSLAGTFKTGHTCLQNQVQPRPGKTRSQLLTAFFHTGRWAGASLSGALCTPCPVGSTTSAAGQRQ
jgi:hypothetical protein